MPQQFERKTKPYESQPKPIHAYDRVHIPLDRLELPIKLKSLKKHCTNITATTLLGKYNPRWKNEVQIFQPTKKCLRVLNNALKNDIGAKVIYAEIACDLVAKDDEQAQAWRNLFLAAVHMKYQSQSVVLDDEHGTAYYYGRREAAHGNKRGHVLAVYADKPSKLNNAQPQDSAPPCFHFEWRSTGGAALERFGIASIDDLIQFDHKKFWDENIHIYLLPKKWELGQILATLCGANPNVSDEALRRRAARWLANHSLDGNFVMHNALLSTPGIEKHLKRVHFWEWYNKTMR